MPEVSVIIPSFGEPDRLRKTVESVLCQTFSDIEVIVVDDNNPETEQRKKTEKIMSELLNTDVRVKYICHECNKNGSAARNTGIRAALGKYISFLDSDDEYLPTRIERCVEALKQCEDVQFQGVYTGCEYRKNNSTYRVMKDVKTGSFMKEYLQLSFNLYTGSNIFITKESADRLRGFDESFIRHQDVEFMIRFFMHYSIIGLDEVLVIKNFDGKNKPSAQKTEEIKKHFFESFSTTLNSLEKREKEKVYGAHYRQLAEQYVLERNFKKASHYYKKVLSNHCLSAKVIVRAGVYFLRSLKER